jgi:hypothetical protein
MAGAGTPASRVHSFCFQRVKQTQTAGRFVLKVHRTAQFVEGLQECAI